MSNTTILTQDDRKILQSFLANVDQTPLSAPQKNWVYIESLLSPEHRMALYGDTATGVKAEGAGSIAVCYRLSDGTQRTATRGTLVPPDARIEYIRKTVQPKPSDPKKPSSGTPATPPDDDDKKPLHVPNVGGG